ncbi:MAG: hypothetical protein ABIR54_19555 [Burkholderiaceae bacterium]|jgi:hypothetical protein
MGYDFILARMRQDLAPFPTRIPDPTGEAVSPLGDIAPLYDAMRGSAVLAQGMLDFTRDGCVVWSTPDGGTLDLNPTSGEAISVDTHAGWVHVAEMFDVVRSVWPDAGLMDFQTGHLHDPASFRAFVKRTGEDKVNRAALLAAARAAKDAQA